MSDVIVTAASARVVLKLPSGFASVWSPGFELHVTGEGATDADAHMSLCRRLRELADTLNAKADTIEKVIE